MTWEWCVRKEEYRVREGPMLWNSFLAVIGEMTIIGVWPMLENRNMIWERHAPKAMYMAWEWPMLEGMIMNGKWTMLKEGFASWE